MAASGGAAIGPAVRAGKPPVSQGDVKVKPTRGAVRPGDALPTKQGSRPPAQPYNPLAPLNPNQIRQQAMSQVNAAYAPAFNALNSQAARAQAIYDKQQSDNHFYLNWLNTQSQALQAHNDAANQQLMGLEQSIVGSETTPGSNGSADQNYIRSMALSGNNLTNTEAGTTLQGISNSNDALGATRLNEASFVQAGGAKEQAALSDTMDKINTAIGTLLSKRATDIGNAILTGQKTEIAKAEYNQNTAIAQTKLGLDAANVNSEITNRAANTAIAGQRLNLDQQKLVQQIKESGIKDAQGWARLAQGDQRLKLDASKYGWQVAKDIYQRQTHTGPYKQGNGSGPTYLGMASQNVIIQHIRNVSGAIDALVSQGMTPQAAYHAIQRGYYTLPNSSDPTKKYTVSVHESDPVILNAALNSGSHGAGLTQGDIQTLTNEGIDPARLKQLLKEAAQPTPQPNQGRIGKPGVGNS